MKTLKAALAVASLLALSACVHAGGATATPHQVAEEVMVSAESAYNVAATAEVEAKAAGLLTGTKATQADQIKAQAYAALKAMRIVYANGGTPDATQLLSFTNDLLAAAGKPTVPADASK